MPMVIYKKAGREIKNAIKRRKHQLQERLNARNKALDKFMANPKKVRSYLVRSSQRNYEMHTGRAYSNRATSFRARRFRTSRSYASAFWRLRGRFTGSPWQRLTCKTMRRLS